MVVDSHDESLDELGLLVFNSFYFVGGNRVGIGSNRCLD